MWSVHKHTVLFLAADSRDTVLSCCKYLKVTEQPHSEFIDKNLTTTKLSLMGQRKSVVKKLGDTKMVIVLNRGYCSQGTFGRRQGWTTIWGEGWQGMGDTAPLSVLTHMFFLFHSSPEFLADAERKTYNWVYTRQYHSYSEIFWSAILCFKRTVVVGCWCLCKYQQKTAYNLLYWCFKHKTVSVAARIDEKKKKVHTNLVKMSH